ncbi:MAG: glucose 1-dehydrogenase [Acidobacteria bacterium]|nr:glucose 1-dehydrogenase [Acidobacteriota bacterium]
MKRAQGKTVIVTGGALGIGRSSCLLLAKEGAKVAVTDLREAEGREVVEEIEKAGGTAAFWRLDITKEPDVERVFREVREKFGSIDALVNNAGIAGVNKPTHEITVEEWRALMDVNVTGVFLCTKYAIGYLKEAGGGSIVNMSSIYGIIGAADLPPYHASKGAVRLMTKNDALIYAPDKIRVNSIHPGYIWTPLVAGLADGTPEGEAALKADLDSRHPIGHVGEPDDIGWGVVYLVSDESKFMTGAELVIDGGYTAR